LLPTAAAVASSINTSMPRPSRKAASASRDSAISGLRYLPIRAMLRNALFMDRLNHTEGRRMDPAGQIFSLGLTGNRPANRHLTPLG
jgi:hypothetical protein